MTVTRFLFLWFVSLFPLWAACDSGPNLHNDCGGWNECEGGVVDQVLSGAFSGDCPVVENAYTCEKGCSRDGDFSRGHPRNACEEWRDKDAGDSCETDRDCLPTAPGTYLRCDAGAAVCVDRLAPEFGDLFASCGLTRDDLAPDGTQYGAIPAGNCREGWCLVSEQPECLLQGCTLRCEWDADCPLGTICVRRFLQQTREDVLVCATAAARIGEGLEYCL